MAPLRKTRLGASDLVLFRSGGTYHGGLSSPFLAFAPMLRGQSHGLTFGTYGSGSSPVLSGYKVIAPGAWRRAAGPVWEVTINDPGSASGNPLSGNDGANIGFLEVDGVIRGARKWQISDLHEPWDFHVDYGRSVLSVFAEKSPGRLASRIAAAPNLNGISGVSGSTYRDLEFHGFGGHGFATYGKDVTVIDCRFHGIGGSQLGLPTGRTRYGNGAQAWSNTSRIAITGCLFEDIYDVAFTAQGYPMSPAAAIGWRDITFADNEVYRAFQAAEFWSRYGARPNAGRLPPGSGFHNCLVENNRFHAMDQAWSASVRADPDVGAALLLYMLEAPENQITVRGNLFEGMQQMIYSRNPQLPPGIVFADNVVVFDRPDRKLVSSRKETAAQFAQFQRETGIGRGCTIRLRNGQSLSAAPTATGHAGARPVSQVQDESSASTGVPPFPSAARQIRAFDAIAIEAVEHGPLHQWIEFGHLRLAGENPFGARIDYALEGGLVPSHLAIGTVHLDFDPRGSSPASLVLASAVPSLAPTEPVFATVSRREGRDMHTRMFVNAATLGAGRLQLRPMIAAVSGIPIDFAVVEPRPISTLPRGIVAFNRTESADDGALLGVGAPPSAPTATGMMYVDLERQVEYRAFGTRSRRDWIAVRRAVPGSRSAPDGEMA